MSAVLVIWVMRVSDSQFSDCDNNCVCDVCCGAGVTDTHTLDYDILQLKGFL